MLRRRFFFTQIGGAAFLASPAIQAASRGDRGATGTTAIPVTSVDRDGDDVVWIVGSDVNAVAHVYRGQ